MMRTTHIPRKTWLETTPQELGLNPDACNTLAEAFQHRGSCCIIKDGIIAYHWGDQQRTMEWASASKPVLSTLMLKAIAEGIITDVNAPATRTISDKWTPYQFREEDLQITWRQLSDMCSGYARPEAPGQAYAYNDYAIQLYWKCLSHAFQEPLSVVWQRYFGNLEMQYPTAFTDHGFVWGSVRDFARIGWLWCNQGQWGSEAIIPHDLFEAECRVGVDEDLPVSAPFGEDFVDDYLGIGSWGGGSNTHHQGPGIYGLNLWFNTRHSTYPDLPEDLYWASGAWNKKCWVFPSQQMVICFGEHWQAVKAARSNNASPLPNPDRLSKIMAEIIQ